MKYLVYSNLRDGRKNCAPNFLVSEFACNDDSDLVVICEELLDVLQGCRNWFRREVIITSGFRSQYHNERIGGATFSQHLYGHAADIIVPDVTNFSVGMWAKTFMKSYGYVEVRDNYVHVDVRKNATNKTIFVDKRTIK